jgi:predicted nucleotidyltransferase
MGKILDDRRAVSATRLNEFSNTLDKARIIAEGKACVYVTGSFGRGEAGAHSDLDIFIVGRSTESSRDGIVQERRDLARLDEICLKAELIHSTRHLKFPPFSGDGKYLDHYSIAQLVRTTGKPDDDANNTFTARLLLLLESRPLIGDEVYRESIDEVITRYWGDFQEYKDEFVPAFLANDILRLWRTFCVNYEAGTKKDPPGERTERQLKNYKLKYSRMLTCYSALVYLLAVYNQTKTVSPDDVRAMVKLTPTERLEWIATQPDLEEVQPKAFELLGGYERFLQNTDADKQVLLDRIGDRTTRRAYFKEAGAFGDTMFELVQLLGKTSRLHRILLV